MGRSRSLPRFVVVFIALCAGGTLLVVILLLGRQTQTVSLEFLHYKERTPFIGTPYAELQLHNGTQDLIRYPVEQNGGFPLRIPILCRDQLAHGWTSEQWDHSSTGMVFSYQDLKPGKSVTFAVPLQPGASPKRIGVVLEFPAAQDPGRIRVTLLSLWKDFRRMLTGSTPDSVWCSKVLLLPGTEKADRQ